MESPADHKFILYDDPLRIYAAMLDDIERATHYVYIETYKYGNDSIGLKFREVLTKKAKQGVEIKVMIDSWGAYVNEQFFSELISYGGEVRFFKKIWIFDSFTKTHRRNHRKLVIIDDKISYISSVNITNYSMNWRESSLRMEGEISKPFKKIFLEHYKLYNKYIYDKFANTKAVKFHSFEIMPDVPSTLIQLTRLKFLALIKEAKKSFVIETPYFLPGSYVRKAILDAAERGILIKIIIPYHSDVSMVDILRNKYLGELHHANIDILFFKPKNIHAKIFVVDQRRFIIGSSNFDYRSFRFMHEINLFGKDRTISKQLNEHISKTIEDCEPFNYDYWLKRPKIEKFLEAMLVPFRHFF